MVQPLHERTDDKRLRRGNRFWSRRATSPLRALPSYLIIGEMKSGTSSLFDHVQRHPHIARPLRKELHYFSIGHHKGLGWYRAHFPLRTALDQHQITGEGCPDYLFSPGADQRIRAALPDVRLIVLLRDPVERAISHYFHEVKMGRERLPIADALAAEDERLAGARLGTPDGLETYLHASYKRRGCYADSLARYFELFSSRQILIIGSSRVFGDPAGATSEVFDFLELPPTVVENAEYLWKNRGERDDVDPDVYAGLIAYFEPHNERLTDVLGHVPRF